MSKQKSVCVHNMFSPCSELVVFIFNLLSYCGLVDVRINASDKDLPVYDSTFDGKVSKKGKQIR